MPITGGLSLLARAAWQIVRPAPPTALKVLEQVKVEVIPAEGTATDHGVAVPQYVLEGMGQRHFYFQAGALVIWLAADETLAEQALLETLLFYP